MSIEQDIQETRKRLDGMLLKQAMDHQRERTCPTCGHVMDDEEYAQKLARAPKD